MSLIDIVQNNAWAIIPEKLDAIHQVLYRHANGLVMDPKELQALYGDRVEDSFDMELTEEGIAVISLNGVLARRMNMMMAFSGGTSMELVGRDFDLALQDNDVKAIVLRMVDVPGGTVAGTETLADAVFAARGQKPMVTFATGMMASAGYWIGSATDRIMAEETADVGSIGVVQAHYDYSQADQKAGVKRSFIYAGKYKVAGNDAEPLNEEMHAYLKSGVDYMYKVFVDGVARNLGVEPADILAEMADGKLFIGRQALDVGLVQEIGNMEAAMEMALEMADSQQTNREVFDMAFGKTKKAAVEPDPAESTVVTREMLEASAPELVQAILAEGAASVDVEAARAEASAQTMERMAGLAGVQFGEEGAAHLLAVAQTGLTVEQFKTVWGAGRPMPEAQSTQDKAAELLAAIRNAGPVNPGHGVTPPATDADPDTDMGQDQLKAQFGRDTELQAEFGGKPDRYIAFKKAEKAGRVKILHAKTNK